MEDPPPQPSIQLWFLVQGSEVGAGNKMGAEGSGEKRGRPWWGAGTLLQGETHSPAMGL